MLSKPEITKVDKINLTATILGPILILGALGIAVWCVNARFTIEMQAQDKKNADAFVSKTWFEKSHDETTKQISDVTGTVNTMAITMAELKGELSVKQPPASK